MTATAPALSAMSACSALVTSMMTPPLSISARPVFRRRLVVLCPLFCDMAGISLFDTQTEYTQEWYSQNVHLLIITPYHFHLMARETTSLPLSLPAPAAGMPLYRWLYEQLRAAILEGRLHPGARLPATRDVGGDVQTIASHRRYGL